MKKFWLMVIKPGLFQLTLILVFSLIKYLLETFEITSKIETPFLIVLICSFVLLIIAIGITGIIENRGQSYETWLEESKSHNKNASLIGFITWSKIIAGSMAFLLFAYVIAPPTIEVIMILAGIILIRNLVVFFTSRNQGLEQE